MKAIPKIYGRNPLCTVHALSAGDNCHELSPLLYKYVQQSYGLY